MTTTTQFARKSGEEEPSSGAAGTIVCPPWCREHWASDEDLGNPDGTYTHDGPSRSFPDIEGGRLDVRLTELTTADGAAACSGLLVLLGDRLVTVATARGITEFLMGLLEQAGATS